MSSSFAVSVPSATICSTLGAPESQPMYMWAATMLPLKTHPVVSSTKDTNIECFNQLLDSMVEE